jgi:sialic acid synthase SpsE
MFDPIAASDGNYDLEKTLRRCWLFPEQFVMLGHVAKALGINFLLSAFGELDLHQIKRMGHEAVKIPSGRSCNAEFVSEAAQLFDTVYCSFGMMTSAEIFALHSQLPWVERACLIPMFCVSKYPVYGSEAALGELARAEFYRGYSAHTREADIILAATAIGHTRPHFTLEFHITLGTDGPDHLVSFCGDGVKDLVRRVRAQDDIFSKTRSEPLECEKAILWRRK